MFSALGIVIVVLMLAGSVPAWPYSREWGYGPSSLFGVLLVLMLIMTVMGTF